MRPLLSSLLLGAALTLAGATFAEEHAPTTHAGAHTEMSAAHGAAHHSEASEAEDNFPHPNVSTDGSWAGAMVIIILLGFFLPAAVIGPIVRANTPEEVPPAHSHDEPPGASHHHGPSGTHAEEPHH